MPFESSTPLIVIGLVAAVVVGWHGLATGSRRAVTAAAVAALAATACFTADWAVVTDREQLQALFPRLATAAASQDLDTLLAAVAPEQRPLRDEVDKVVKQLQPADVEVTRTVIEIAPDGKRATADLVVRLTGNLIDRGTRTTAIVAVHVSLEKRDGAWLVIDADEGKIRPVGP
jgi:curli biogenesis system outer membrane secretion channel CsgG